MVAVSDYIKKLLFQYDCVVVPEMGGFILRYLPAEYAEGTETYLPPRKKVAFNEALKLDDGILVSYMMLHETCTREEALQHIRSFAEGVKHCIRFSGSYHLEGVGLFTENEEGKLQFDPELRHNFIGEAYGFQPISVHVVAKEELMTSEVSIYHPAEEVTESVIVEHPATKTVRRSYWRWVAAALLIGSVGAMSYFSFSRVPTHLASSLNPFDLVWTVRDFSVGKVAKVIPAPVVVSRVPVQASKQTAVPALPGEKGQVGADQPISSSVEIAPDKKEVEINSVARKEVTLSEKKEESKYKYVAIAGSFSTYKNARKFQKQLRRLGYEEAFIVNPDATKGLIKVAAFGFNKRSEVEGEFVKVTELTGSEAWISRSPR